MKKTYIRKKLIGVLYGGWSAERAVSINSGRAVIKALRKAGCRVKGIDVKKNIASVLRKSRIDIAFIALHGPFGEDGRIQTILELLGIPYTGSGVLSSMLAMNKIISKKIFDWHGLPTPEWGILFKKDGRGALDHAIEHTGFPAVVKPVNQGSTVGISIAENRRQLPPALRKAFRYGPSVILEKFIGGRELTVSVIGSRALPVTEIIPVLGKFYDYRAKYSPGGSRHVVPAKLRPAASRRLQKLALDAFNALGCSGVARVDFRMDGKDRPYILEVNTVPGMTKTSLLPEAAAAEGTDFSRLVLDILENSGLRV